MSRASRRARATRVPSPAAARVALRPSRREPAPPRMSPTWLFLGAAALVAAAVAALGYHLAWPPLAVALLAINIATFALYAYDKAIAGRRRLRVPERVLHLLAMLGGTVAALLAQRLLRHKVSKYAFLRTFWLLTLGQLVLVAAGAWLLHAR